MKLIGVLPDIRPELWVIFHNSAGVGQNSASFTQYSMSIENYSVSFWQKSWSFLAIFTLFFAFKQGFRHVLLGAMGLA
ncbi:MAG: hypothetical protein J1E77_01920 [Prevotella sp.]|nr:hypothetical protein [Prevotella sp.]